MKKFYKSLIITAIFTALFSLAGIAQNAWINEFHYDDYGADTNEFIEVVIQNPGNYTLSSFSVVLYNGVNGGMYDTKTLDLFTVGATVNGFKFYTYFFPLNGIQNGAPDGIVLAYNDVVISGQFLSYEGAFTATDGPASGMSSVDILVMEVGVDEGLSLQLAGTGTVYGSFAWQEPAAETHGQLNNDQDLGPVGIDELGGTNFTIYPNPNNGSFRLSNPSSEETILSIYNVNGQLVIEKKVNPGETQVSLENISDGIYMARISDKAGKMLDSQRIVIY
jgi:hypothetical protein